MSLTAVRVAFGSRQVNRLSRTASALSVGRLNAAPTLLRVEVAALRMAPQPIE
jgi:hypothetical protein